MIKDAGLLPTTEKRGLLDLQLKRAFLLSNFAVIQSLPLSLLIRNMKYLIYKRGIHVEIILYFFEKICEAFGERHLPPISYPSKGFFNLRYTRLQVTPVQNPAFY